MFNIKFQEGSFLYTVTGMDRRTDMTNLQRTNPISVVMFA